MSARPNVMGILEWSNDFGGNCGEVLIKQSFSSLSATQLACSFYKVAMLPTNIT